MIRSRRLLRAGLFLRTPESALNPVSVNTSFSAKIESARCTDVEQSEGLRFEQAFAEDLQPFVAQLIRVYAFCSFVQK